MATPSYCLYVFLNNNIVICIFQNPPSIPTMAVVYTVAKVRFSKVVIDWHNYGHTILAMALGKGHPLVRFASK